MWGNRRPRRYGGIVAGEGESTLDSIAHLNGLRADEATGILHLDAGEWGTGEVYLLAGTVIACSTRDDGADFQNALVSTTGLTADDLVALAPDADGPAALADALAESGRVSSEALADAEARRFRFALQRLLGPPHSVHRFESRDAVFPPNMQFGVDIPALIAEAEAWRARTEEVFARCADGILLQLNEASDLGAGVADLLGNTPRTMPEILDALGADLRLSAERAAALLERGGLVPAEEATELSVAVDPMADLPDISIGDLAPADASFDSLSDLSMADVSLAEDPDEDPMRVTDPRDIGLFSRESAVELSLETGEVDAADVDGSDAGPAHEGISEADYEKAAQGGFIKSYEVLDKVDLSGVAVLGTGAPDLAETRPDGPPVPLYSLGEIEALGEVDEIEAVGDEDEDDDELPPLEISRGPDDDASPPALTPFESGDFEAVFSGGFDDADASPAPSEPAPEPVEAEKPAAGGLIPLLAAVDANARERFEPAELHGFADRITIFSSIFRIIFSTFSEHIGEKKARQRFNALLGSSQRQYPELFRRLEVDQDGAIDPALLINNLAACPPGDYGSLLHQGLYELIFSHLYDAKDLLPGDAETKMMEKIVVYERQLHDA